MPCCDEHGCRRKQPILIRRGAFSEAWYAITRYTVLNEETGLIRADQKHQLPDDVSAALEDAHQWQRRRRVEAVDVGEIGAVDERALPAATREPLPSSRGRESG